MSVSLPRLAVAGLAERSTTTAVVPAIGDEVDAGAAVELVVAGPAVEHVAAVAAVQRVVAAQALEVVVAGQAGEVVGGAAAGEHVVVGGGAGRERLVDLDRADVGQAAGRQRARVVPS